MKLHLPTHLFRAVIALMVTVPSALYAAYTIPTEIVIPELYTTEILVDEVSDISAYADSADAIAFRLIENVDVSALDYVLIEPGLGSFYFTSHTSEALKSLSFSNNTACLFNVSAEKFLEFIALQDVSFNRNTGPIHGERNSTITLNCNEAVTFSENTSSSYGGAIYGGNYSTITLSNNGEVEFSGNTVVGNRLVYGGAIYGASSSTITLSNNDTVTFSGNSASGSSYGYGGAIYGGSYGTITLSNNDTVTFSGNSASGSTNGSGGAIYGYTITLSGNGTVNFSENTASDYGGAIYDGRHGTITLSNNGMVIFSGNTASSGGAIYGGSSSTITLSNNGTVSFSENTASGYGGAISGGSSSTITLNDNDEVTFSGNTASSGGAIYGESYSTITLSDNTSVSFSGNTASSNGGAIYEERYSTITLSNNDTVSFSENSASSGGTIYGESYSTITLSNNDTVSFSGNTASGDGGAIYGAIDSTIKLSNNGEVSFTGNSASSGGAIYSSGDLHIRNNDSVEFAGNVKTSGSSYRLQSIYVSGGSGDTVSLSAAAGKSIIFRDSVYIGSGTTVDFNADYTDAEGNIHAQKGDILFTGATTEADLLAAKGSAGTAAELLNSRTTEVLAMTNLYGGRLRVEDGAVYQGQGITVHEGSEATVRVKDATLNHAGYELLFNHGTKLEVEGNSSISGSIVLRGYTLSGGITINPGLGGIIIDPGQEGELWDDPSLPGASLAPKARGDLAGSSITLPPAAEMSVKGSVTLDGGLSISSGSTPATLRGVTLADGSITGTGALTCAVKNASIQGTGASHTLKGVKLENVQFASSLTLLKLTDVEFDDACMFSVGAEGTIVLNDALLCVTLPELGTGNEGVLYLDCTQLFHCTVEGDLKLSLDTAAVRAAGYSGLQLDFGSDANYETLTLNMNGATYTGNMGSMATFDVVPEPATATLSLLALAALASRRRRG